MDPTLEVEIRCQKAVIIIFAALAAAELGQEVTALSLFCPCVLGKIEIGCRANGEDRGRVQTSEVSGEKEERRREV